MLLGNIRQSLFFVFSFFANGLLGNIRQSLVVMVNRIMNGAVTGADMIRYLKSNTWLLE